MIQAAGGVAAASAVEAGAVEVEDLVAVVLAAASAVEAPAEAGLAAVGSSKVAVHTESCIKKNQSAPVLAQLKELQIRTTFNTD